MGGFFKKAVIDRKESATVQHEVYKAEAKASFEENRGKNTFKRAKAKAKKSWDDAHMSPSERAAKMQEEREAQIAAANERQKAAEERIADVKGNK